jgi:hypothetical protein
MTEDDKQIYLRVLNDLSFMWEVLKHCEQQADEFPSAMLRDRIILERNAFDVEENRRREEDRQRQEQREIDIERKSDD